MSIDKLAKDWLADQHGGVAVLAIQNGKTVHKRGYGLANVETKLQVDASTMFDLASLSKHFTATAVMLLADRGKLGFDDPLTKHLPFPAYADKITIRHLLHHTGGLKDYFKLYEADGDDKSRWGHDRPSTTDIALALAKEPHPAFAAGKKFDYSNSGYVVLAEIVSRVSGKAFPDFMRDEIWSRLGMSRTRVFDGTPIDDENQAQGYEDDEPFEVTPLDDTYGDGAVHTTLDDLELWSAAVDANSVVSKAAQELAWTTGTTNDGEETGYGFGWFVGGDPGERWANHEGEYGGFHTYCTKDLDAPLTIFVLANFDEAEPDKLGDSINERLGGLG